MDTLRLSVTVLLLALRRIRSNCGRMPVTQPAWQPDGHGFQTNPGDVSGVHPPAASGWRRQSSGAALC